MQYSHHSQSDPVQSWKGDQLQARKETIRHEAEGIRRSDQAYFQKEVQDYEEDHFASRLH